MISRLGSLFYSANHRLFHKCLQLVQCLHSNLTLLLKYKKYQFGNKLEIFFEGVITINVPVVFMARYRYVM
jgi:hypothetical protein